MNKYKFNLIERQSLYEAYKKKCFYCGELLYFREMQIDHIVPEKYLNDQNALENYLNGYKSSDSFKINSYYNWVPCHSRCNNRKSGDPFNLQTTLYYLELVEKRINEIKIIEEKIERKIRSDILMTTIAFALEEKMLDSLFVKEILAQYEKDNDSKFTLFSEVQFVNRIYRNWITQNDFPELLLLPVKTGSPDDEGVILTNPENEEIKINIKNCKEYFHYIDIGYYPSTTYDMKMCAFFEKVCGLVKALKNATIPSNSFITDENISIKNFELLPLKLFDSYNQETFELVNSISDITFRDWIDQGFLNIIEEYDNGFKIEYNGEGLLMVELIRADLNNDDIEDILVFCYTFSIGGTLGYGFTKILTRLDNKSNFIEL